MPAKIAYMQDGAKVSANAQFYQAFSQIAAYATRVILAGLEQA